MTEPLSTEERERRDEILRDFGSVFDIAGERGDTDYPGIEFFEERGYTVVPSASLATQEADTRALREEIERLTREDEQTMAERDAWEERLDVLAYAIAPMSLIGEHSLGNDPWLNALEIIQNAAPEHLALVRGDTYDLAALTPKAEETPR